MNVIKEDSNANVEELKRVATEEDAMREEKKTCYLASHS